MSLPKLDHFIAGQRVAPASGRYLPVENPATGEVFAEVADGDARDVDRAVAAARAAFADPDWRNLTPQARASLLCKMIEIIKHNAEELVYLESLSTGGTVARISTLDLLGVIDLTATLAETIRTYPFVTHLPARPLPEAQHVRVVKEPIGVCALITAWNFPLFQFIAKAMTALAAGNTCVVKPPELAPNTSTRLAELFSAVLPAGVLNVVNGTGAGVGDALTGHVDVRKISFTGSTAVGRHIQARAAATIKRVTLELGGKGPAIVTADADLNLAAYGALYGFLVNGGQACESGTRLIVHESIHDALLERMRAIAAEMALGNPLDPATSIGPMCHAAHGQRVLGYVESALAEGARLVCGGERIAVPGCDGGFFIAPTILADCRPEMRAVREEIFGPVLTVLKYRSDDEAVALANDTHYGLSAGLWTGDVVKAQAIAARLNAGSVWINDWHVLRSDTPFGGFGQSGAGREFGVEGLEAFLETKSVVTAFERDPGKRLMTYAPLFKRFAA